MLVLFSVLGLVAASVLSGRVASERVSTPTFATRDIVLCLDVSGSMYEYDTEILRTFADMVDTFDGERIALSIFNSTSRTVFPLTNDYDLVEKQLRDGAEAIDFDEKAFRTGARDYSDEKVRAYASFTEGTRGVQDQASIIPDGVAACGQLFDQSQADRSRSVILATDNEVNGEPIYTLQEAVQTLADHRAALYTFYPGAFECSTTCAEELQQVTEEHEGRFYSSRDPGAIPSIIASIQRTQAAEMGATPTVVRTDHPMLPFLATLLSLIAVVAVGWRSR